MIDFPKTINIKGSKWKVKFVKGEIPGRPQDDGYADPVNETIMISLAADNLLEVFLHELGHAILHEVGVCDTSLNGDLEEIIVQNYSTAFMQIFDFKFKK